MNSRKISSTFAQTRPTSELPNPKLLGKSNALGEAIPFRDRTSAATSTKDEVENDIEERELRQFDLDSRYGPLSGLTRLERWERAERIGLSPPKYIKELVLKHGVASNYNAHVFTEGKI